MYNYDRAVVALQAKCMFWLLTAHIKDDLFLERIRHSIRSHMANIWERSVHTISLIPPSKSSSSFNTSNRDPTSFILMSATLSRRVGWNETVRACRDPFDNKKFSNLNPEILVEWIPPTVSYWCSHRNSGTVPVPVQGFDSVVDVMVVKHQVVLGFSLGVTSV